MGMEKEKEKEKEKERSYRYSCSSASETVKWINAIVDFLRPYSFFTNAHLVNFFTDKLWEEVEREWMECLGKEAVENLLQIPSGVVLDHWPASLRHFLLTLNSLLFPRQLQLQQHPLLHTVLGPPGLQKLNKSCSLNNSVLSQGMNAKKKHEVEILSALVSSIAHSVGAHSIIDVGAGQGYLSQVLSFHYHHSVVAIDASSHHGNVTDARALRIYKHYASQLRKSNQSGNKATLMVPKTITCRVMSIDMLKDILASNFLPIYNSNASQQDCIRDNNNNNNNNNDDDDDDNMEPSRPADCETSVVLAGLHACGDLSVMMLRAFLECKQVKAVVSIGCCYNLLSEEGFDHVDSQHGFPLSRGVKSAGLSLGKSLRDLACQSAERWRCLETDDGIHNFELHAFRAAFQMILKKYHPEIMLTSPSIGRQGKALRRLQKRETLDSLPCHKNCAPASSCHTLSTTEDKCPSVKSAEPETGDCSSSESKTASSLSRDSPKGSECDGSKSVDKYSLFQRYSQSGLCQLGLEPLQDRELRRIWDEVEPFSELVGPYWSLRAALGPLLETYIVLDRLLFLQEAGNTIEAVMLPIFDPEISPRNVAIIAKKK